MSQLSNASPLLDREQVVALVRKWAEVNTDGILDKTTQIFSVPHIEGLIGYRVALRTAVVYGDPVCAPSEKIALAKEFESYCRSQRMKMIYIITSEEFARLATKEFSCSLIEFGKKFILDPMKYGDSKTTLLRKKLRQSFNKGVTVHEYLGNDPQIERSIEQIATQWVESRKGLQIYLAKPSLFADRLGKRWFYAKQGEQIIGFALLNKIQSQGGWLLNNVMVCKDGPSGVSEHLVTSALESAGLEQCRSIIIGPVPAHELGEIIGIGQAIISLTKWTFKILKNVGRLNGHQVFWEKFQPEFKSSYLLFPKNQFRPSSVIALLRALNITLR